MNQPLILGTDASEAFWVTIRSRKQAIKVKGSFAKKRTSYNFSALLSDKVSEHGINKGRIVKLKVYRFYPNKGIMEMSRFNKCWYTVSKPTDEAYSRTNRRNLKLLVKRLECFPTSVTMNTVR